MRVLFRDACVVPGCVCYSGMRVLFRDACVQTADAYAQGHIYISVHVCMHVMIHADINMQHAHGRYLGRVWDNELTRGMIEGHRLLAKVFRSLPDYAIRKVRPS